MASIIDVRGFHPKIGNDCFLAENATIIGDVVIGDRSSVWFQAVVRGDVHEIRIGNEVNMAPSFIVHTRRLELISVIESALDIEQ